MATARKHPIAAASLPRGVTRADIDAAKRKMFGRIRQTELHLKTMLGRLALLRKHIESEKYDLTTAADKFIALDLYQQATWRSASEQVSLAIPDALVRRHRKHANRLLSNASDPIS